MNNDQQNPVQNPQPVISETPSPSFVPFQGTPSTHPNKRALIVVIICASVLLLAAVIIIVWLVLTKNSSQASVEQTTSTAAKSSQGDATTNQYPATDPNAITIRARDTERKTDMDMLSNQLEAYYAKTGGYPTISDINNQSWRNANDFSTGDNNDALADPLTPTVTTLVAKLPSASTGSYTYRVTPDGCVSATNGSGTDVKTSNLCTDFTLTALLENKSDASKDSSSNSTQTFFIKKSVNY